MTRTAILSIKRLSYEGARILIDGAQRKAAEIGVPMCLAVVDESGTLIAFSRMDGGKIVGVSIAQDKAYTAAVARRPTHEYNELCVPGNLLFGIHTACDGRFTIIGGGLPVKIDDTVIGGIGASSGTPDEDIACAQAGIDHFLAQ